MSVLILAAERDPTADRMVRELVERGAQVHRIDTAWFPVDVGIDAQLREGKWEGRIRYPRGELPLGDIEAIWYRSPTAFRFPAGLTDAERMHANIEAKMGFGGVLLSLPVLWVNRPDLAATACYKPLQLSVAARVGLTVVPTLVTNNADTSREFVVEHQHVVTKMFAANSIVEHGKRSVAFTRGVSAADLDHAAGLDTTTHQFQAAVPKSHDARVVVVDSTLFGFEIHPDSEAAQADFRSDYDSLRYQRVKVPPPVADGVRLLTKDLGLSYAAIDFVVDHDGHWVFIGDVNPGGQYGWLEAKTGAPITATLAELLTNGSTQS